MPSKANSYLFFLSPILILTLSLLSWVVIPFALLDNSVALQLSPDEIEAIILVLGLVVGVVMWLFKNSNEDETEDLSAVSETAVVVPVDPVVLEVQESVFELIYNAITGPTFCWLCVLYAFIYIGCFIYLGVILLRKMYSSLRSTFIEMMAAEVPKININILHRLILRNAFSFQAFIINIYRFVRRHLGHL